MACFVKSLCTIHPFREEFKEAKLGIRQRWQLVPQHAKFQTWKNLSLRPAKHCVAWWIFRTSLTDWNTIQWKIIERVKFFISSVLKNSWIFVKKKTKCFVLNRHKPIVSRETPTDMDSQYSPIVLCCKFDQGM